MYFFGCFEPPSPPAPAHLPTQLSSSSFVPREVFVPAVQFVTTVVSGGDRLGFFYGFFFFNQAHFKCNIQGVSPGNGICKMSGRCSDDWVPFGGGGSLCE